MTLFKHCREPSANLLAANSARVSIAAYISDITDHARWWDTTCDKARGNNRTRVLANLSERMLGQLVNGLTYYVSDLVRGGESPERTQREQALLGTLAMSKLLYASGTSGPSLVSHPNILIEMRGLSEYRIHGPAELFTGLLPPDDTNYPDGWYRERDGQLYVYRPPELEASDRMQEVYRSQVSGGEQGIPADFMTLYPQLAARLMLGSFDPGMMRRE